jgi:uncharacterized integral membrane protein
VGVFLCVCVRAWFCDFVCVCVLVMCTLTEVFPCFFLNCKANARVKLAKTGHGPHSSKLVVICVGLLLFVLFYVLLCVNVYCTTATG